MEMLAFIPNISEAVFSIYFKDKKQCHNQSNPPFEQFTFQLSNRAQRDVKLKKVDRKNKNMNKEMNELGRGPQYFPADIGNMMSYELPGMTRGDINHRQMKQLVDEMRFKEKMEVINRKKGKYKRSTNNCHKKYIGIVKNLVCLKMDVSVKEGMLSRFFQYRNSRVYYFIILNYLKWHLSVKDIRWVFQHFCLEVGNKIERYQMEVNITSNSNFVHFRGDQILEMKFSIQAIELFLSGHEEEAIRLLYQKNKYIIIKKNQYLKTLQIIRQLTRELEQTFPEVSIRKKEQELQLNYIHHFSNLEMPPQYMPQIPTMPQNHFFPPPSDNNWSFPQLPSEVQPMLKMEFSGVESEVKGEMGLMKNDEGEPDLKKLPLLALQNSYPVIDYVSWHSWLLSKQKRLEFLVKSKEEPLNQGSCYASPK